MEALYKSRSLFVRWYGAHMSEEGEREQTGDSRDLRLDRTLS